MSLAPKLSTADAEISFGQPAFAVDRRVRACTPDPGPWTTFRGERLKLGPVTVTDSTDLVFGQLSVDRQQVLVGTASMAVRLSTVQPPGKRAMPAADWARGVRLTAEDRLGG